MRKVQELCVEKISLISTEDWKKKCECAFKYEEYWKAEGPMDDIIDSFIINLQDDSNSDNSNIEVKEEDNISTDEDVSVGISQI